MSEETRDLTPEELAEQQGEPLPDREVMSVVSPLEPEPLPAAELSGGPGSEPSVPPPQMAPEEEPLGGGEV